jgi:hypothetical protein
MVRLRGPWKLFHRSGAGAGLGEGGNCRWQGLGIGLPRRRIVTNPSQESSFCGEWGRDHSHGEGSFRFWPAFGFYPRSPPLRALGDTWISHQRQELSSFPCILPHWEYQYHACYLPSAVSAALRLWPVIFPSRVRVPTPATRPWSVPAVACAVHPPRRRSSPLRSSSAFSRPPSPAKAAPAGGASPTAVVMKCSPSR